MRNPCRVSHAYGLASSSFARHYSRNHGCFLFLRVLRCFTSPRSLHTAYVLSFIGSWCQGIHRAPLKTWPQMLASTVQFSNNDQPPITPGHNRSSLGPAI